MSSKAHYPRSRKRVSAVIRRIAGRCERCGAVGVPLSVHHLGAPYADGRPGNPHDKHDLRRENLQALCQPCHWDADFPLWMSHKRRQRQRQRHLALGIGTGLVLYQAA